MKYSYYTVICALLIAVCLVGPSESRGGRGRGSGSFGGIFGGWRSKYGSKSSSSGGGRRVVSGSPVHTAMTVPKLPPPPPPPQKPMSMPKPQVGGYPKQQLPPGYSYGPGVGQGTYYSNPQALPAGAMYYPQGSTGFSMGSGTSGFLTGMLAGRLMEGMLFGRQHHVSHVYHGSQTGEGVRQNKDQQIIIVENGQSQPEGTGGTDSDVESLDESHRLENPLSREEEEQEETDSEEVTSTTIATQDPQTPPVGRIVCFPVMVNETDAEHPDVVREVERVACFPASSFNPSVNCENDPQCSSTTSTEPPIVAGDIGGAGETEDEREAEEEEGEEEAEEVSSTTPEIDTANH